MSVELDRLLKQYPILKDVMRKQPVLWKNPDYVVTPHYPVRGVGEDIIFSAIERFKRFRNLIKIAFPETNGTILSPISTLTHMKSELELIYQMPISGMLLLKRDDLLPVAGSIKARGGFHEVLAFAEKLAFSHGILQSIDDDYVTLLSKEARKLFQQYTISVGSTGNLGLSIGMIGSTLGFQVVVHMSADAKEWKKELLRKNGVKVVEYQSDYTIAVENARNEAANNDNTYFVDDENSSLLFAGYAAAGIEVKKQFDELGIKVDAEHPLFVYLPCGVGGGPGGVTFGLKQQFGEHVHCFFAEPLNSPCMLTGLVTKLHHKVSVEDLLLDNKTEADGLAVGRPSGFVGPIMEELLAGIYTLKDEEWLKLMYILYESQDIFLEPSALAGMKGPVLLNSTSHLQGVKAATHLVWATGGSMFPKDLRNDFLERGKLL
ncbi:D-serine ammonia-lyase [Fredinandcohnia humi]